MNDLNDLAFSFRYDNPFENDSDTSRKNALISALKNVFRYNIEDECNKINFKNLKPKIRYLYGCEDSDITKTPMFSDIKDVANSVQELSGLNSWCRKFSPSIPVPMIDNEQQEYEYDEYQTEQQDTRPIDRQPEYQEFGNVIPNIPYKYDYSKTAGLTNYDFSSSKLLSYEDIRQLTINIARSKNVMTIKKDENILALEKKKRDEMVKDIIKYKNIKKIAALVADDISSMDLTQLSNCLEQCKTAYEKEKLIETFKRGCNFGTTIFGSVFPSGIKVGKDKRIKTKGIIKTITNSVFDTQSAIGIAFQNIIDKHHWKISDEAVLLLSLGEMVVSNIEIEKIEPTENINNEIITPNTSNTRPVTQSISESGEISEYEEEEDYE